MSYVSRTLGPHERILFRTSYHWLVWLGSGLLVAPAAAVALGAFPFSGADYFYLAFGFVPLPFGLYYIAKALSAEIVVTNERFVYKVGLVSFRTEEIGLDNIETIAIEQSILGRLFGYGTITVRGTGSEYVRIAMVSDPVGLRRHIPMKQDEANESERVAA